MEKNLFSISLSKGEQMHINHRRKNKYRSNLNRISHYEKEMKKFSSKRYRAKVKLAIFHDREMPVYREIFYPSEYRYK